MQKLDTFKYYEVIKGASHWSLIELLKISIWKKEVCLLRAFTSVLLNFLSILHEKTYFFYFTLPPI